MVGDSLNEVDVREPCVSIIDTSILTTCGAPRHVRGEEAVQLVSIHVSRQINELGKLSPPEEVFHAVHSVQVATLGRNFDIVHELISSVVRAYWLPASIAP